MCEVFGPWEEAVKFHGHSCPGLAMGVRAGQIALERLRVTRAGDEELVAIVETDACGVDGIQVITGCTLGKGNLFFKDYGKQAYTVAKRGTGEAVRVLFKPLELAGEQRQLRQKVASGEATEEEQSRFKQLRESLIERILHGPAEEICVIKEKRVKLPGRAQIFPSVKCDRCGEYFMEPRGRLQNGRIVCLGCFENYDRNL